jgi:S-adenosylmethionine decarboxylase
VSTPSAVPRTGTEWIVDAYGCPADALRSEARLRALLDAAASELDLHAVAPTLVHVFPPPGGITAVLLLSESHLACHTFPESGYAALNLYCCRARPAWDFRARLAAHLGASSVEVRVVRRGGLAGGPASP